MQIKAAIFDMDGTLVDSLILWEVFWSELGERFLQDASFRPTAADDRTMRTMTLDQAMELAHRNYGLGESGEQLLGIVNVITEDFYRNKVLLKPGAKEYLEHLYQQGVKMVIASGTEMPFVELALDHCELRKYFSRAFSCCDINKGKDQPDIYLLAQQALGEKAEDIWVFEDSLTAIETVQKLGMHTVALFDRNNYGQEKMREIAEHYIAEGEELTKLLEEKA